MTSKLDHRNSINKRSNEAKMIFSLQVAFYLPFCFTAKRTAFLTLCNNSAQTKLPPGVVLQHHEICTELGDEGTFLSSSAYFD